MNEDAWVKHHALPFCHSERRASTMFLLQESVARREEPEDVSAIRPCQGVFTRYFVETP